MKKLRIVFMGTPDFAVGILDAILQNQYEVVGVITAPDKPAGRGQKLHQSAVKEYAKQKGLPVLQPTNLKDEEFLSDLKALNANLQIVVAFRMLPKVVWDLPELGTFNLHASLLPNYRGAAPINWAIINGETETGVTTFFIDDKIDTGAIILSKKTPIISDENAGHLHDRLMTIGAKTVIETLHLIENEQVKPIKQVEATTDKTAYKLNKENCKINWDLPATAIYNLIRGLSPYPAAWCTLKDQEKEYAIKIFQVKIEFASHTLPIGTLISTKKTLKIALKEGYLEILELQFPGKKRMKTPELLNGISFSESAKVE